jgi:tetratricopeptide (TPR) repeat protein
LSDTGREVSVPTVRLALVLPAVLAGGIYFVQPATAQLFGSSIQAQGCAFAAGGNVSESTIRIVCGIPPDEFAAIIAAAADPLRKLNQEQQVKVDELTRQLGVNEEQLRTFFTIIGEAEVRPEQIGAKLVQIAGSYRELLTRLNTPASENQRVETLKQQAKAAVENNNYSEAETSIQEMIQISMEAFSKQRAQMEKNMLDAANAKLLLGLLKASQLNFKDAAEDIAEGVKLVPENYNLHLMNYLALQGAVLYMADPDHYQPALATLERAISIGENLSPMFKEFSGTDRTLFYIHSGICLVHFINIDFERAYKSCVAGLKLAEQSNQSNTDLNNILTITAIVYQQTGRFAEAEPLLKRAIAITEKAYGPDHPQLVSGLQVLALVYQQTGRFAEAEPLLKRAIAIGEKTYGPDDPQFVKNLQGLALVYQQTGRFAEAEPIYERAIAIAEKILGFEHSEVATDLNKPASNPTYDLDNLTSDLADILNTLAMHYRGTGRLAEAEQLLKQEITIGEKIAVEEKASKHPLPYPYHTLTRGLGTLAEFYQDTGRFAEAEPLLKRIVAIEEETHGSEYPGLTFELHRLARFYEEIGRLAEAEPLLKRIVAIEEKAYGPDHLELVDDLFYLALFYENGRSVEAEPLLKRIIAIEEKAYGPDRPQLVDDLQMLTRVYWRIGRFAEAEPLLKRAIAITERAYGSECPDLTTDLDELARLYGSTGRFAEAEPLLKRAIAITEKAYGPDHPQLIDHLNKLAELYYRSTDHFAEAEPLLKRAIAIGERTQPMDDWKLREARENYARLLDRLGRYGEAAELRAQAQAIQGHSP